MWRRLWEPGVRAELLFAHDSHFITSDDPVVFFGPGGPLDRRAVFQPTEWTAPGNGIYLSLAPNLAVMWSGGTSFDSRQVSTDEVLGLNKLVRKAAFRQIYSGHKLTLEQAAAD